MNKRLASAVIAVGLAGGGAAGVLFGAPSISSAQTATTQPSAATADPAAPAAGTNARPDRGAIVTNALKTLVDNGTITQVQSDAVAAALQAAAPQGGQGGQGGHGGPQGDHAGGPSGQPGGRGQNLDIAATALGITAADLKTALDGGQNIAQVAASKGVDVQKVIDALVADYSTKENAEVATGDHTQAEVDAKIVEAKTRITDMVNGKAPTRPAGAAGAPGTGTRPAKVAGSAPAPSTTATTATATN
jgi:hypothetical protein